MPFYLYYRAVTRHNKHYGPDKPKEEEETDNTLVYLGLSFFFILGGMISWFWIGYWSFLLGLAGLIFIYGGIYESGYQETADEDRFDETDEIG